MPDGEEWLYVVRLRIAEAENRQLLRQVQELQQTNADLERELSDRRRQAVSHQMEMNRLREQHVLKEAGLRQQNAAMHQQLMDQSPEDELNRVKSADLPTRGVVYNTTPNSIGWQRAQYERYEDGSIRIAERGLRQKC